MNRYMIEQIAAQLQSAAVRIAREARKGEEGPSIGTARLSALSALATAGPLSLAQLAAADKVRAPTMSRIVDALVKDRLVTRDPVPTDRRTVRIAITEDGRDTLSRERSGRVRQLADRLERLGESEQRALQRGIELLDRLSARN